jgi:hypothetical protein
MSVRLALSTLIAGLIACTPVHTHAADIDVSDPLGIRRGAERTDEIRRRAAQSIDYERQRLAEDLHALLDHASDILQLRTSDIANQLQGQQDSVQKNIELAVELLGTERQASLDQAEQILNNLQHTFVDVARASKAPFVTSTSPTYVLPFNQTFNLLVKGSYLHLGTGLGSNRGPRLRIDTHEVEPFRSKENELVFSVPKSFLPTINSFALPVPIELSLESPKPWWKPWGEPPRVIYMLGIYELPGKVGDVKITAYRDCSFDDSQDITFGDDSKPLIDLTDPRPCGRNP